LSDSLDLIIPVFVASASALGSVIVWWLNQSAARSAIAREHKRDLYQQLIEAVFIFCGLNHEEDEHNDALYALDRPGYMPHGESCRSQWTFSAATPR